MLGVPTEITDHASETLVWTQLLRTTNVAGLVLVPLSPSPLPRLSKGPGDLMVRAEAASVCRVADSSSGAQEAVFSVRLGLFVQPRTALAAGDQVRSVQTANRRETQPKELPLVSLV